MKKPETFICDIDLGEKGNQFTEVREGVNSYIEGVKKIMSGLELLSSTHTTSLADNMMMGEQLLDVEVPATFVLHKRQGNGAIYVPATTWLIHQTVYEAPTENNGIEIRTSGLVASTDFDRSDIGDDAAKQLFFEGADNAFGHNNLKVFSISVSGPEFLYALYGQGTGRLAVVKAYAHE